jgi:tetratricopeptide (TPR) repeat protein
MELDNLRAALTWSERGDPALGFRLISLLWFFLYLRGRISEGRDWLERMLAINPVVPLRYRIFALRGVGALANVQGDSARATAALGEALGLCREDGDEEQLGRCMNQLAIVYKSQGEYDRAMSLHEESLTMRRMRGDKGGIVESLTNLGTLAQASGKYHRARELFDEALALERTLGDTRMVAILVYNGGELAEQQGEMDLAVSMFTEALDISRGLGDLEVIAFCLDGLARVAHAHARTHRAGILYGAAAALRESAEVSLNSDQRSDYERVLADLRSTGGEDGFVAAWNDGRLMPLDQAIAYALEA